MLRDWWNRVVRVSRHERALKNKNLDKFTAAAMREALQLERAQAYFALTATTNIIFVFAFAFSLWAWLLGIRWIVGAVMGAAVALVLVCTICAHSIFSAIRAVQDIQDRQAFVGLWIKIGIVLSGLGFAALLARTLFTAFVS